MRVFSSSVPLLLLAAAASGAPKPPMASRFFERHEDPVSHVVSWIMKPGAVAHNQQSLYFTSKSMTDDGRFLVFHASDDEFTRRRASKRTMLIDFETDELVDLSDIKCNVPFIDTANGGMWYVKDNGICRRDLCSDPKREIRVCEFEESFQMPKTGVGHLATHLTLTADRRHAFLDWCHSSSDSFLSTNILSRQLLVDLATGKAEEWGRADIWMNHGQLHPTNPDLAMCAYEGCAKKWIRNEKGESVLVRRPADEVYPRLILVERGRHSFVQSLIVNYATHEHWSEDGSGFYWCASGVHFRDLATGVQRTVCPFASAHATLTADNRYVTSDVSWGGWWRGCGWTTSFWNRDTHQGVFIHSKRPVYATKDRPSRLHPDPHPQFVCADRYVVCTMNVKEHQMTLSVTPVADLVAATSRPQPSPSRLPLVWDAHHGASAPCEVTVDWRKRTGLTPPLETGRQVVLFPGSLGVEATLADGSVRRLDVTPLAERAADLVTLRFRPPAGAVRLDLLSGVGGRFELQDSEHCDNLFLGTLDTDAVGRWTVTGGQATADRFGVLLTAGDSSSAVTAECAVAVPDGLAGQPCKFEADLRTLSDRDWDGAIVLRQLDAKGNALPEPAVDPRRLGGICPSGKKVSRLAEGLVHKDAKKLVLSVALRQAGDRAQTKIHVTRLALRAAATIRLAD